MTKERLAEQILQTIENNLDTYDRAEHIESIISFLDTLQPKDAKQFAKWGYPEDKSTEQDCWK